MNENKWHWVCLSGMSKKQKKAVFIIVEMFKEVNGVEIAEGYPKSEKTLDSGWRVRTKIRTQRDPLLDELADALKEMTEQYVDERESHWGPSLSYAQEECVVKARELIATVRRNKE